MRYASKKNMCYVWGALIMWVTVAMFPKPMMAQMKIINPNINLEDDE